MAKRLRTKSLLEIAYVADPQLDPAGQRAAATVTRIVPGEGDDPPRYRSRVSLFNVFTGDETPFTAGEMDTHPRFSPDGVHLAFLSKRGEERPQLWLIALGGGEARRLTNHARGVEGFAWHPDGGRIAYVSRGEQEEGAAAKGTGTRTIDRLVYRYNGRGFLPAEPAQIHLYELARERSRTLTELAFDPGGLAFSPDGRRLYFAAATSEDDVTAWTQQLFSLALKGKRLTPLLPEPRVVAPDSLAASPDGEALYFLAPADPSNTASPSGLWRVPASGGEPTLLTGDEAAAPSVGGDTRWGAFPNTPAALEDGSVLVNRNREGRSGLAAVTPDGRLAALHDERRVVTAFAAAAGRAVFTAETPDRPGELFVRHEDGSEVRLSGVNDAFCERYRLMGSEGPVVVDEEASVAYWTLAPHKPRKDDALVLEIHGGPQTNYGYGFSFEFQRLAAAGFTVVFGNPRGGSSFGQAFATAMQGAYGSVDADDVLAIARHARARHRDPDAPMHVTGGSYGGFMTNWLVGHTDEFRSAVTQRSICNWLSFYGTADIGPTFAQREVGGSPWADLGLLWDQSPLKYAADIVTPLLILHAEEDYRCPVEQAEQLFTALKVLGRAPTRLVRFPGENHELSRAGRPDRRIERIDAILGWFEEHA